MAGQNKMATDTVSDAASTVAKLCTTRVEIKKYTYIWKIQQFSSVVSGGPYKYTCCPKNIKSGELKFLLVVKNMSGNVNNTFLSLTREPETMEVLANFTFSILYKNVKWCLISNHANWFIKSEKKCFGVQFNFQELLEKVPELIPGDVLTILCEISAIVDVNIALLSGNKGLPPEKVFRDLFHLLENGDYSDFTLVVKNKEFKVHKNIFSVRSPVFSAMLRHDMKEKNESKLIMQDIDLKNVDDFLEFIYTGKLPPVDIETLIQLLCVSEKYDVTDLKAVCQQRLMFFLKIENAIDIATAALMYNASELEKFCSDFIFVNSASIFKTSSWKKYALNQPNLVNSLLKNFSEITQPSISSQNPSITKGESTVFCFYT